MYNGGNHRPEYNERARWYAESYGLPQTSGSDTHWSDMFVGGILTECDIRSTEDYLSVVRSGIAGLIENGSDNLR